MEKTEIIRFENVVKKFDSRAILNNLSFSVYKGEILCIVGPSGTGKSVTLKNLVKILTPTSGNIIVDATNITTAGEEETKKIRERIGYLFQSGALLAWMTVAENVALPLEECTNLSQKEIDKRVTDALAAVELLDAANKYPAEISGGMQKRAGLARAIVRSADILLFDEPTSGLDSVTSLSIHRLIRRLNRERGITCIVVTHDLTGALALADRLLLLKDGRALICETPENFVKSENPIVKDFLTAMSGKLEDE